MKKLVERYASVLEALLVAVVILGLIAFVIKSDTVKTQFSNLITNSFSEISQEAGIGE